MAREETRVIKPPAQGTATQLLRALTKHRRDEFRAARYVLDLIKKQKFFVGTFFLVKKDEHNHWGVYDLQQNKIMSNEDLLTTIEYYVQLENVDVINDMADMGIQITTLTLSGDIEINL